MDRMNDQPNPTVARTVLVPNKPSEHPITLKISNEQPYSRPYWLELPKDGSMYTCAIRN